MRSVRCDLICVSCVVAQTFPELFAEGSAATHLFLDSSVIHVRVGRHSQNTSPPARGRCRACGTAVPVSVRTARSWSGECRHEVASHGEVGHHAPVLPTHVTLHLPRCWPPDRVRFCHGSAACLMTRAPCRGRCRADAICEATIHARARGGAAVVLRLPRLPSVSSTTVLRACIQPHISRTANKQRHQLLLYSHTTGHSTVTLRVPSVHHVRRHGTRTRTLLGRRRETCWTTVSRTILQIHPPRAWFFFCCFPMLVGSRTASSCIIPIEHTHVATHVRFFFMQEVCFQQCS